VDFNDPTNEDDTHLLIDFLLLSQNVLSRHIPLLSVLHVMLALLRIFSNELRIIHVNLVNWQDLVIGNALVGFNFLSEESQFLTLLKLGVSTWAGVCLG
jgi:hypothetical protein